MWLKFSNNVDTKELSEKGIFEGNVKKQQLYLVYKIKTTKTWKQKNIKTWKTGWYFYFYLKFCQHEVNSFSHEKHYIR